jgi:aminoglycoside N3'-acetyltransferase
MNIVSYGIKQGEKSILRLSSALEMPIPIDQIQGALQSAGIRRGDSLFVHSSLTRFYHGGGNSLRGYLSRLSPQNSGDYAIRLIQLFLDFTGSTAVLMFPSDFMGDYERAAASKQVWSLKDARTKHRGYLSEVFRTWTGTIRSTHPIYNVTAQGKDVQKELRSHWDLLYSMDIGSPWHKFMQIGGKAVFFGVDFEVNSFIHLPEYIIKNDYPKPIFFNRPHSFIVENPDGCQKEVLGYLHAIKWPHGTVSKFCQYLNNKYGIYKTVYVRNTPITVFRVKDQYDALMLELEQGVSWYDAIYWR